MATTCSARSDPTVGRVVRLRFMLTCRVGHTNEQHRLPRRFSLCRCDVRYRCRDECTAHPQGTQETRESLPGPSRTRRRVVAAGPSDTNSLDQVNARTQRSHSGSGGTGSSRSHATDTHAGRLKPANGAEVRLSSPEEVDSSLEVLRPEQLRDPVLPRCGSSGRCGSL